MKKMLGNKGFTLIELVLVITILGILAVVAIPQFADLRNNALEASRDGVTGAIRSALTMERAKDLANNVTVDFPAPLDAAANAAVNDVGTTFFSAVLEGGIEDGNWTKTSPTVYVFRDGDGPPVERTYTYDSSAGTFK